MAFPVTFYFRNPWVVKFIGTIPVSSDNYFVSLGDSSGKVDVDEI